MSSKSKETTKRSTTIHGHARLLLKAALLILIPGFLCTSCKKTYTDLSADDFEHLLLNNGDSITLVDVRTQAEYDDGHLFRSVNVNVLDKSFLRIAREEIDSLHPVAVYCKTGNRSGDAATRLSKAGYKVYNLKGGLMAWKKAGKPISR
jgi:carboxyl-terminal processing protease